MYKLGQGTIIVHEDTLRDVKRALKLVLEAHIARTYGTFVVKGDDGALYDVELKIQLRKK